MKNTSALQVTTPTDLELVITRQVDAPRRLVFEAWTNPTHVPRWMLGPPGWTMPVCEIDLRVGGAWHFIWRNAEGGELEMRGIYKEIIPPERLVSIESWGGPWPETLNTLILSEEDGKTTVRLKILYPSKEAREAAMKTGMADGMAATFAKLDEFLAAQGFQTKKRE
jgi:uncharacterized protein YndB with AHSA1/START domain